ncbi:ankyrin repeat domain-containing protein 45-like [Hydractinia symbiolongicarpus]|uniref:ankyrin repeat domain-containing protein 45-like n=1 Tax=Hydractinia symbiolongicarpus TaxID=13093 RepID=UPI00254A53BF|nr:ankyrin repeat domain-containing protein 45-like [Hydractinia symbiolongicarpus]
MFDEFFNVCVSGDYEKLVELLEVDVEKPFLKAKSEDGKTGLELASSFGHLNIVQELLKTGAQINSVSDRGYSLIHWAACWGHLHVVKYLVDAGAHISCKNIHNETAKQIAERYKRNDCVIYLEKAELLFELKRLATSYKEVIADPEKNMGKLTKEDKIHGNRYCDEKIYWIENNRDMASAQQISDKINELKEQLRDSMSKLDDS